MQTIHAIMPWLLRAAGLALLVVGALNVLARRIPAEYVTSWERTRPRLANVLRFLRAVGPDMDKALPVLWALVTGKPWPAVLTRAAQAPRVPTVPPAAPLALLALAALGGALQGCPSWQRPACDGPGRYRCAGDRPEYCAPSRHWTPAGDVACGPREACSLRADGVARCAPVTDGGVP